MTRRSALLVLALLVAGCAEPAPSPSPTPSPTPTPTVAPTPTPDPVTLAPAGRLIVTKETLLPVRTKLNLLLPKGGVSDLVGDGSRLYFIAAPTAPRVADGASAPKDYALYVLDPTATSIARVVGSVTPRELGRPKESAVQTGTDPAGVATWSIRYAGGVCYRANGSYTNTKPTNAYLYAYDQQLSVEAEKGERGRCIFTEFAVYPTPVTPWADGAAPDRLCPPDRPDCASETGTLAYRIAGPVEPRAATDATLPLPPVTLFTTTLTGADGQILYDTLRFLKANGTQGEVRYGGVPLDGATSRVIAGPDGLLYLIVRSAGDPANRAFLARLDPADPRTVTPLTTPPSR